MPEPKPLVIEGLGHAYGGVPVFEEVNLTVGQGELVAVLGTSGSGKSTLLRAVAGFIIPTTGIISLGGVQVVGHGREHVNAEKRRVGMVFQDYALFEHMTVADNIGFGTRDPKRDERIAELLLWLG